MSRVDKKKIEKKQKIKETILGLTLAISIGVAGSVGSYAYFSDRVNTDNGIKITMGTLDVGIGEGFNQDVFEKGIVYEKNFNITNEGTLDEILTLKFENILLNNVENHNNLEQVYYKLKIENETIECNLKELSTKGVNIGRLNLGESISCTATLENRGVDPSYEQNTVIKFDLVVDGVQINDESVQNGGAYNEVYK